MTAYYNEIDPYAAQWLRNLIDAGHIAPGVVDTRSIEDITPNELREFTQCHFFAGIGVWSLALRRAGWSDDRPVWTGSCPCQPFSSAGAGGGFTDERHLWPAFFHLIEQCKPAVVFGEQVASKDANPWIDLVQTDLEAVGYGVGAVAFPSAGVGAPHIRDRLYWVADSERQQCEERLPRLEEGDRAQGGRTPIESSGLCLSGGVADANSTIAEQFEGPWARPGEEKSGRALCEPHGRGDVLGAPAARPTNGFWRDADWLLCRDGKWRPVEPGTFPLVNGAASRVGRLRAYGNAINAKAAQVFIESYM